MNYFLHEKGLCESRDIGNGTRIWAFAHVLPGARIGADCNICDGVFIENDVVLGDRVTVKCGVQLWDGITIEDDVFIGPNVTFTNDIFPRSRQRPEKFLRTVVRAGASIGANATLLPGIEIGAGAMVGAGAVVTRSVPPNALVVGEAARIRGYVGTGGMREVTRGLAPAASKEVSIEDSEVRGVRLYRLPKVTDLRGSLTVGEFSKTMPFVPKRFFVVYDVPSREVRGEHAHHVCEQFLICIRGSCSVVVDDGSCRREYLLDDPTTGLHLPAMVWGTQYRYTADAALMVFASEHYDPADYIRDYSEYLRLVAAGNPPATGS